ncbi:RapZ C-terminal domain-containing protein [Streptosporangium sp. DT93]|uniref:RapZ C-terminal domain-containing protein n=1 Tax=Streptosporangium sp. DT93 TaxID=3393428 RepID=UPI003CE8C2BE
MTATTMHVCPWAAGVPAGTPTTPIQITITSFGYNHGPAPTADITVDARRLHIPTDRPGMSRRTGRSAKIRRTILVTPGARELVHHAAAGALDLMVITGRRVTIAAGCATGRHASVVLAREIGRLIRADDITVRVEHRDIDKPALLSSREGGA